MLARLLRDCSIASLLLLSSCFSSSLLQEPMPMRPGQVRMAIGIEGGSHAAHGALAVRVGVVPRTELRAKYVPKSGYELGINVQALEHDLVDVMLMPSFFEYDVDNAFEEEPARHLTGFSLPTVISVQLHDAPHRLFVAPDVRVGRREGRAWSALGLHLGFSIEGPRGYGSFIPECAVLVGVAGRELSDVYGSARVLAQGEAAFSCSMGVSFGASTKD